MSWITLIGDLHGRTPGIRPDSRLVLLAGDICPDKDQEEFLDVRFRRWLGSLPCPVVAVGGNHDKSLESPRIDLPWTLLGPGETTESCGWTITGMPLVLDTGMAFYGTEEEIERLLEPMQAGIDILLCHNPPAGVLDHSKIHQGSVAIRYTCWKKKPKLCVFGHCHEARGHKRISNTYYVNATLGAGCNSSGLPVEAPYTPWGLSDSSWR